MRGGRTLLAVVTGSVLVVVPAPAAEDTQMIVTRSGAQSSTPGPAENFTGAVRIEMLFPIQDPSRVSAAAVTFEPGAHTAWHSHPAGQTLVVVTGNGWVQRAGGEKKAIKAGDVVWTPPGVKHWHGATAADTMTHIAIQETVGGTPVHWLEKVTDEQYGAR